MELNENNLDFGARGVAMCRRSPTLDKLQYLDQALENVLARLQLESDVAREFEDTYRSTLVLSMMEDDGFDDVSVVDDKPFSRVNTMLTDDSEQRCGVVEWSLKQTFPSGRPATWADLVAYSVDVYPTEFLLGGCYTFSKVGSVWQASFTGNGKYKFLQVVTALLRRGYQGVDTSLVSLCYGSLDELNDDVFPYETVTEVDVHAVAGVRGFDQCYTLAVLPEFRAQTVQLLGASPKIRSIACLDEAWFLSDGELKALAVDWVGDRAHPRSGSVTGFSFYDLISSVEVVGAVGSLSERVVRGGGLSVGQVSDDVVVGELFGSDAGCCVKSALWAAWPTMGEAIRSLADQLTVGDLQDWAAGRGVGVGVVVHGGCCYVDTVGVGTSIFSLGNECRRWPVTPFGCDMQQLVDVKLEGTCYLGLVSYQDRVACYLDHGVRPGFGAVLGLSGGSDEMYVSMFDGGLHVSGSSGPGACRWVDLCDSVRQGRGAFGLTSEAVSRLPVGAGGTVPGRAGDVAVARNLFDASEFSLRFKQVLACDRPDEIMRTMFQGDAGRFSLRSDGSSAPAVVVCGATPGVGDVVQGHLFRYGPVVCRAYVLKPGRFVREDRGCLVRGSGFQFDGWKGTSVDKAAALVGCGVLQALDGDLFVLVVGSRNIGVSNSNLLDMSRVYCSGYVQSFSSALAGAVRGESVRLDWKKQRDGSLQARVRLRPGEYVLLEEVPTVGALYVEASGNVVAGYAGLKRVGSFEAVVHDGPYNCSGRVNLLVEAVGGFAGCEFTSVEDNYEWDCTYDSE